MRPVRLELEGFTAFKDRVSIDFDGVETFALSGPTGSGKSSIIDAITFALYGSVSRYKDPKLVYPIISQGLVETKVRFDFRIGGILYTAVRIVRKQKRGDSWGATTKEARLESGDKVLAGNTTELDEQIRKLFGLDFNQFTSCVVLPQGEFAKFLNEEPSKRQDLLKNLLRIQIYDQIGRLARAKATSLASTKHALEEQYAEYSMLESSDKQDLKSKVSRFERLLKDADTVQKGLSKLEHQLQSAEEVLNQKQEQVELLEALTPPKDLAAIGDRYNKSVVAFESSEKRSTEAETILEKIEKKLGAMPDVSSQKEILRLYDDKSNEESTLRSLQRDLEKNKKVEDELSQRLNKLNNERDVVVEQLSLAEREHAAYHLAKKLSKGDKCPICERPLTAKPQLTAPKGYKEKEAHLEKVENELENVESDYQAAVGESSTVAGGISGSKGRLAQIVKKLLNAPSMSEIKSAIKAHDTMRIELDNAKEAVKRNRKAEKDALVAKEAISRELKQRWKQFDDLRDSVAVLKPPSLEKEDYEKSWRALTAWAASKAKEVQSDIAGLSKESVTLKKRIEGAYSPLRKELEDAEINVNEVGDIRDALVESISEAKSELKNIEKGIKKSKELKTKIASLVDDIEVGKSLGLHMGANYFERWILQEAFDNLVIESSKKLEELTSGDYSFAIDERLNFDIIDHRNAEERRSSRTLSGGETFLASLALALTLSEQIAQLATDGSAPLESIFLDEGFGTLDPEALETVASAIEELASKGRIIGLVTHVKELADRVPTQYKVHKAASTSTVEKIVS
jgi:exonuclease SbcC